MTSLPDTIRIGPFDYKILRPKSIDGDESWGQFDAAKCAISISAKLPTNIHEREIFMHELFHGLWYHSKLGKRCDEERAVSHLADKFICFVRDNPWFMDWLKVG